MKISGNQLALCSKSALVAMIFLQMATEGFSQNRFKPDEVMNFFGAIQMGHESDAMAMLEKNTNLAMSVENVSKLPLMEAAAAGNVKLVKRLLELGANVNAQGDILLSGGSQNTALHFAIQRNHLEVCRVLLEAGADPNKMAFGFQTPLHLAFNESHEDIASLLLDYGSDPFQGKLFSNDETTPFELAITKSNGRLVPRMLGLDSRHPLGAKSLQNPKHSKQPGRGIKSSGDILSQHGVDLMTSAVQRGELEAVSALFRAGVNIKAANSNCPTIFQLYSLAANDTARNLPSTIDQWHRVQDQLKADYIPQSDPSFVSSLRSQEASLSAKAEMMAPERWQKIRDTLIERGAYYDAFAATALGDTNQAKQLLVTDKYVTHARDCNGQTLLHWSIQTERPPMLVFWIAAGVPLDAKNNAGQTALHLAATAGKVEMAKTLLSARASTSIRDTNGWTPLDAAIQVKQADCIHLFLSENPAATHPERGLAISLHEAAATGNIAALAAILETQTNLESKNELGLTPLQLAVTKGHLAAAALLVDKGANLKVSDPDGNSLLHQIFLSQYMVNDRPPVSWLSHLGANPQKETYLKYLTVGQYEQGPNPVLQGASFLLACGLDAKATNHAGETVMQLVTEEKVGRGIFFFNHDREQLLKLLGGAGGNVNQFDAKGETALHRVVVGYNAMFGEKVDELVASGADVNATNFLGQTPLHVAANNIGSWPSDAGGAANGFIALIKAKANVNAQDNEGRTPLHVLALAKCSFKQEAIQALIKAGANPNLQDRLGMTPLHLTANSGLSFNESMVENLLDAGANPNVKDKHGRTPVHLFLSGPWPWNSASRSLQELAKAKADFSVRDDEGKTPLHYLAALGSEKSLFFIGGIDKILMESKVDFQAKDNDGNTPAMIAAKSETKDVFDWLVKQGADLDTPNKQGETARLLAAHTKSSFHRSGPANAETDIFQAASIGAIDAATRLLKADSLLVNQTNQFKQTPLFVAVFRHQTNMVSFLEAHGAKWVECSAVLAGRSDVLRAILKQTPSVITNKIYGRGLIHIAAANGDVNMVKLLISANCDLQAKDSWELSPLGYALIKNHKDVQELLLQHGAKENFFDAVYANDLKSVATLISHDKMLVTELNSQKISAADIAAAAGYVDILKLLLKYDVPINSPSHSSAQLATFYNQPDALAALIRSGAHVDQADLNGFTAMHWAAIKGATESATLLLKHKADVNRAVLQVENRLGSVSDPNRRAIVGNTPLHLAALCGQTNMVQLLLKSGADVNAINEMQLTPLDQAESMQPMNLFSITMIQRGMLGLLEPLNTNQVNQIQRNPFQANRESRKIAAALIQAAGGKHSQNGQRFGGGLRMPDGFISQ